MLMNVSVLGLSGPESERGAEGVGKSCFCNRFVRPSADDYQEQHLWMLSSSDFNSRVVNSDHFLYWGAVPLVVNGTSFNVNVTEQTEFIHDETLRPFPSTQPYHKRAISLRLHGHDKLAYFSKFQLGFENEYPVIPMSAEWSVDGFILCCDVSSSHRMQQDNQDRLLSKLAQDIQKLSKPFIIVATKMDVADSDAIAHLYEVINGNRYLKNAIIIETSAKLNINIDAAFISIASLISKFSSNKQRIVKFAEACSKQSVADQYLSERFQNFLLQTVLNWNATWPSCESLFIRNPIYQSFVERFGSRLARNIFDLHVNHLCTQAAHILVRQWLCDLPAVFDGLFGEIIDSTKFLESGVNDSYCQELYSSFVHKVRCHSRFEAFFQKQALFSAFLNFPCVNGQSLLEIIRLDKRMPEDILDSAQAFEIFRNVFQNARRKKVMERLRSELKTTLENDNDYAPGMRPEDSLLFVRSKYGARYEELDESAQRSVFDQLQPLLADRAIRDLRNLIEQNCADIVFDLNTFPDVALDKAERILSGRARYRRCDRLPQLRTQILRDWLSAARSGDCRCCPSGLPPNCMANRVRQSLNLRPSSPPRRFGILLIGAKSDAVSFESTAKLFWADGVIKVECPRNTSQSFRLDFVRLGEALAGDQPTGAVNSRSVQRADALIFLVSNQSSLHLASESLQNISIASISAPRILCLLPCNGNVYTEELYSAVSNLGEKVSAELVDCRFTSSSVSQVIMRLVVSATQQVSLACSPKTPDVRIALFCRCSDSFSTDVITSPLLKGSCFHLDSDDQLPSCISVVRQHLFLDSFRKTVQILLLPYHARANPSVFHAIEKTHGIILAFDPTNPQSFATAASEANRKAGMPIFLLAVDESGPLDTSYTSEPSRSILNDAATLAEKLSAHFVKTTATFASQPAVYTPFIRAAFDRREKTEQLWTLFQQNRRIAANATSQNITVNSLGRTTRGQMNSNVKESSSLNHLGLVLPSAIVTPFKEKVAKKASPDNTRQPYQLTGEPWSITEHPIDLATGASLPIAQLLRVIEALGGLTTIGIYRVPGSSLNSQTLMQQFRAGSPLRDSDLMAGYDVQTLATTLKAVLCRSDIIGDELAFALVEHFSKDVMKPVGADKSFISSQSDLIADISLLLSDNLPVSPHRQTLRLLFSHLAEIAQRQPETMNAQNLARVFWPSLLNPLTKNIDALEQVTRLQNIAELTLVFMIEHWHSIFPEI